ncbi:hypothetical protein D6779_06190 [Candidatus Parcubacteria bacterium]|nr:MAG: hypothetical protein D6779_06190 [Candidatus Parcubacteria bacterium]
MDMSIAEVVSIAKDVFLAAAAATTAVVAILGLNKWSKELRGKANFEVAKELLKATYHLRDAIDRCRSPWIDGSEFPEGYKIGNNDPKTEGQAYVHVFSKRLKPIYTALQHFDSLVLEAEALWGGAIREKANEFRHCVRILEVDIETMIEDKFRGGELFKDRNFARQIRSSVFNTKSKDNELTKKIEASIQALEDEIRPHLSRK